MQEDNVLMCLDIAYKSNIPKQQRKAKVAKSADWQVLNKKWRSILTLALDETEIPGDDENNVRPNRMMRRRTRGSNSKSSLDWLPQNSEIIENESETAAFRLGVLLINKQLKRGEWNEKLSISEAEIREDCLSNGIHKVWHILAEKTPLLGQFHAFPIAKKQSKKKAKADLSKSRIDIFDTTQLSELIENLLLICDGADEQIAIQKVQSQISAKRAIEPAEILFNLKGDKSLISVILALVSNQDASSQLKELAKKDKSLAAEFEDLYNLMNGTVNDWESSINAGEDGLSNARRRFAWLNFPDEVVNLTHEEIAVGIEILEAIPNSQKQVQNLRWIYLSCLAKSGKSQEAAEILISNTLDSSIEIEKLYDLVSLLSLQEVEDWIMDQLHLLDDGALQYIVNHQTSSLNLQNECFKILQDNAGEAWDESSMLAVQIFAQNLELRRLSEVLTNDELAPISYPYETLLSYHILATNREQDLWAKLIEIRQLALTSIHSTEPPSYLSPMSQSLIMLMEGNKIENEPFTTLGRRGYQALKLARHALKEGGTGLASRTHIEHLSNSVEQAELSILEQHLFSVLIGTLKLNQATKSLQHGDVDEEIFTTLNSLVSESNIPTRLIHSIRQLVFEYDIGLDKLVTWYQVNDPLSPWHTLSRAALFAQNNDELNAAREYRRVAEEGGFDFEGKMILYRKSLIHLAHAEQWSESVDLLDNQPALRTAITKRFQLYLRVSYTASKHKTNDATQLLKDFVRRSKDVEEENLEGEVLTKRVNYFAEDELDTLRNYPFEHSRELPAEPFLGRVTAALTSIQRNKRRGRHGFDNRFRTEMAQNPPTIMAIYDIARDSADKNPIEGLMYLERAQNSGKFNTSAMKRLFDAERSLFATHRKQIPNSSRRYLKNLALPPLVVVDTNILVNALVEKIAKSLELASETSLDLFEYDNFHKVLISRANSGRINLWLPTIVKHEITEISKRLAKLRTKFKSSLVKPEVLDSVINEEKISQLIDEIIEEFSQWKLLDVHTEKDAKEEEVIRQLEHFLYEHHEIYDEVTLMKLKLSKNSKKARTEIHGEKIFPESADREIMAIAKVLASHSLDGLGSILIASKDSDFTVVARAFEERFGYGVIKNSKMLNSWLN